ncbi:MAG: methyltransferase domain-containing protein [Pirellulales bacterium]|nr:methyltransferase domain-containing protein [Pirellulales bacterium]
MWSDLVCPIDQGALEGRDERLVCRRCGSGFPVLDSIPTFLAGNESTRWRRSQRRWLAALPRSPRDERVQIVPELRERGRRVERLLRDHVALGSHDRVLQIGAGAEGEVHHFQTGVRYAVDPLAAVLAERRLLRWGQVRWVAARGEQLPFADGTFSAVILANVLNWVDSPRRVMFEAWRCLTANGVLLIAHGANTLQPLRDLTLGAVHELSTGFRVLAQGSCGPLAVSDAHSGAVAARLVADTRHYLLLSRTAGLRLMAAA